MLVAFKYPSILPRNEEIFPNPRPHKACQAEYFLRLQVILDTSKAPPGPIYFSCDPATILRSMIKGTMSEATLLHCPIRGSLNVR